MVPFRDQSKVESRSVEHIGTMRLALEAAQHVEMEPLLTAKIDGNLLVVDGHHRLEAYRLAGRETAPVRMLPMEHRNAVLISKLVNCSERALEMHAEQKRDAAWQYMAAITRHGAVCLPDGESLRTIAGRFGISKDTAQRMLRMLPKVNPKDWSNEAHDPGTGFPRWRYVREVGAGWQDMKNKMTAEEVIQYEAEKLAKKIGALLDRASPEAVCRAMEMLANEARLAARNADTLEFLADIAEPDCDDY
jgi:ParB-like chromosome segregation protein Spo0J